MSIAELSSSYTGSSDGPPDDRLPPQDLGAEQSVLGSMLLNKDAIADCLEVTKSADFYRPAHELIYDAILDLYGRGEPADAITVADELGKRGDLTRVGGQAYLHQLIQSVPTAANAGYYAEIVHERAVLRRLVEAGTRIVQMGYGQGEGDVDEIVNRAQAEVYSVAEKRGGEDYHQLGEILNATMEEIEAAAGRTDEMTGVPTGFLELDQLTNGLHPGQMIVVAARPAVGKALALDTPLPTPSGWTTMGDVAVGDHLLDAHGRPTRVVAATEVMEGRPCFEVEFSDGTVIVADAQHQWAIEAGDVVTTQHLVDLGLRPKVAHDTRYIQRIVPTPSVPVRCVEVDNDAHLYLAGRSMIPTHNSTLGIDIARAASIKHNMATAVFSLEMSRTEITMRILSAEATIQLQDLRKGLKGQEQWNKLARIMGKISDAPLFIDDSPNMSLMEIRSKCRRLKQQHNLRMVIIDYLQLMSSGKKVESRQQEVAEFSRALKLLAKELEVPVIAISQLNRGPEQRTDKRPQMSDLRESGCLPAETRILRADTGAETTIGEIARSGQRDLTVWALDDGLRYTKRTMTHAFTTGTAPVFRLTLASGKTVRATENHPFLTYEGWAPLASLRSGDRVAVPRHVPSPLLVSDWSDGEVVMLAHLIGDGSFVKRQPIRYASIDEANLEAVTKAALVFGITAVRDEYAAARCTTLRLPAPFRLARGTRNPIAQWLDGLGLFGARSHEKFVPHDVFCLPKEQIALFVRHLWATDGSVTVNRNGRGGRIYYASTSRRLVDDVSRLLLRFGIQTRMRTTRKLGYRDGYTVDISGVDSQRRFLQEIGVHGARGAAAERLLEIVRALSGNTNVDTVPKQVWDDVRESMSARGMTTREFQSAMGTQYCGSAMYASAPSRQRLARVADVLGDAELELMAVNDVFWDSVVSVEPDGIEEVFDATVLDCHNFIADGIAVHNSIEQDADMVILLHRDRSDPERDGEADVIVAKHRNGPTADIVLAFQGHYSRFSNMARDGGF
ncbi:DNA helicase [Knoellia flava TL1]|uniref:Replicative DNA helicase n=2 Tax=Knoellia flava TaxID=913969 RepID=A0A8H9KVA5_9MICO|nr:replicative DNA helicase [Knoellia flava]KGN32736.1 DNA helicase [Knoellia flava TL1]GGB87658.1 replicative DNA helicase [Knoellia flava]